MTAAPEIEDVLALSPLQEGLFTLSEMAGDGFDVYSMQFVVEISGPLDAAQLHNSVDRVIERHPNLRVSLWDKDLPKPVQIVPSRVEVPWEEVRASAAQFDELATAERARRFDLRRGPAIRVKLVDLEGRWRLLVTAHHILMDGWSIALFFQELLTIYAAGASTVTLPPVRPYRNYIAWLAAQDTDVARAQWVDHLAGVEPLMLGEPGASVTEPVRTRHRLPVAGTERLVAWARSAGLTVNTAVQYAWATVLGRLTDRDDVVFGTTISGRPQGLAGADEMIGLFINTVPSRVSLATSDGQNTVVEHCRALQRASSTMRDHGYLGLSDIQRASGHVALFDTLFVFENAPIGAATEPVTAPDGTRFLPLAMESLAHYPLTVVAYLLDGELVIITETIDGALGDLRPTDVAQRLLRVLEQLPAAGDGPADALDVLLSAERALIERTSMRQAEAVDLAPSVIAAFLDQARRTPEAPALVDATQTFGYAELAARSARLAGELRDLGIGPESVVAIALPRSADSVITILATMHAGGAYVPVDVALPDQRMANMLAQSGARVVVTDLANLPRFQTDGRVAAVTLDDAATAERIAARPAEIAPPALCRESSAYVIFTSGSTGEPKGVIGTHAALVSYCRDHRDHMLAPAQQRLGRPLRVAHAWTFSFDASWQPLAALLDGHAVHLFGEDEMRDADRLVAGLTHRAIDMIDTTPSMFGQLAAAGLVGDEGVGHAHLSVLALGGEAIGPALWQQLSALPATTAHNCYGPTETTVEAVVARIPDSPEPTIGSPTDRMAAYILDSRLRQVPTGIAGELYLSGAQVTRGYVGRSAMTAGRFVADPFVAGERMYRTGDLVRRNDRGDIVFVGRRDDQVKIRGYRIETGEIEAALRRLPGIRAAAVVVVDRTAGPALVGFAAGAELDARQVRLELAEVLPAHMVPTRIVTLPILPMNSNGKVDSRALAESAAQALQARSGADTADLTATGRVVSSVIGAVLGSAPAADEDFFDLGLDSIVAMAAVHALREHELTVTPRMVLAHPTVADLADAIDRYVDEPDATRAGPGIVPALPIVEWLDEYGNDRRFTQTVLFALPDGLSEGDLQTALQTLIDGHDMLRATRTPAGVVTREAGTVDAATVLNSMPSAELPASITTAARCANDAVDPDEGRMLAAVRLNRPGAQDILLLAIHHLAVDAVSWQIIFDDLAGAGAALAAGTPPTIGAERTDYRHWCTEIRARADRPEASAQLDHWISQVSEPDGPIGARMPDPRKDTWSSLRSAVTLTPVDITRTVLGSLDKRMGMREFLLAALALTIAGWRRERGADPTQGAYVALEGHGRDDELAGPSVDTTRTLGWFTTVYPVRLGTGHDLGPAEAAADRSAATLLLDDVATDLSMIPGSGIDFGILKYVRGAHELVGAHEPQIEFNYLGRFDLHGADPRSGGDSSSGDVLWQPWMPITDLELNDRLPTDPEPDLPLRYTLDVVAVVRATEGGPQLVANWRYGESLLTAAEAERLTELWQQSVSALASVVADQAR
ncbi:amino acid adenylation domain-containing protein [Gordonia sp. HNM0687]|uniref:Amino acid adenylation domain-containing protein n=1 Tax=Gordonia mangrovi TaxID=2665643 RepID=A0A6L7GU24_9ACTN|nr:non-ribosomal peptide synthetase [Gordonia mangrovi]MXP22008.1 amino acid adenylation domain-containing protein [Gordonia mangrovi]UVF76362.1 non-ribosomal peptide synthetase [Gordonia mangrovi]